YEEPYSSLSYNSLDISLYSNDYETAYVTTPNGSSVVVFIREEFSSFDIYQRNSECDRQFPKATRLRSATRKYNCHSYAWYSSSTSNTYWMDDPSLYYKDGSYTEVRTPQNGDIICYFDDNGTPNDFSDDTNLHSGIVISYNSSVSSNGICGNSNQVVVRSKWGAYGLYEHNGDYCPYVPRYGGQADYVKYFRHFHDYHEPYTWKNYTMHTGVCGCGDTKELPHAVSSDAFKNNKNKYAYCLICGGLAEIGFTQITSANKADYVTENGSFILPNGVVVLVDEDIEAYLDGSLEFIKIKNDLEIA
ncbi:MAG: hypothetical protein K2M84_06995, partial [Anaeroplasmataceae bacterium]|nr:hypothetical protein [Anaeroplasmataceae bacterium]